MSEITIEGINYLLPKGIKAPKKSSHRLPKQWTQFFYYRDRTKTEIADSKIKCDSEITSRLDYCVDTFYRISCIEDDYFDFFFKLKPGVEKIVIKKNNRFKEKNFKIKAKKLLRNPLPDYKENYKYDDKGRVIVSFR